MTTILPAVIRITWLGSNLVWRGDEDPTRIGELPYGQGSVWRRTRSCVRLTFGAWRGLFQDLVESALAKIILGGCMLWRGEERLAVRARIFAREVACILRKGNRMCLISREQEKAVVAQLLPGGQFPCRWVAAAVLARVDFGRPNKSYYHQRTNQQQRAVDNHNLDK